MDARMRYVWRGAITLTDATTAGPDGLPRKWIMMLPLGEYEHPEHGTLNITPKLCHELITNFTNKVRHIDISLDVDHKASQGDTRATGWLEAVQLRDATGDCPAGLWGLVCWTGYGVKLLKDKEYKYFSIEFGPYEDAESGQKYGNVILGGALTNRPFMKQMPAIALGARKGSPDMAEGPAVIRLMGGNGSKAGPKGSRSSKVADYDPTNIDNATAFDDGGDDDTNMDDGGGDDDTALDDGSDDDTSMDDAEGDDDTSMDDAGEGDDASGDDAAATTMGKKRMGKSAKMGKSGKKMSESAMMAEYTAMRHQLAELRREQYTTTLDKLFSEWKSGKTVVLSDGGRLITPVRDAKTGKQAQRRTTFALTPKAERKIRSFLTGPAYAFAESTRTAFLDVVQTLLSDGVVELGARGGSYTSEATRTVRGGTFRRTDDEVAEGELLTLAEGFAASEGKTFAELTPDQKFVYLSRAEKGLSA